MPQQPLSFEEIAKQIQLALDLAKAKLDKTRTEEREIRLGIKKTTREAEIARDALADAQRALDDHVRTASDHRLQIQAEIDADTKKKAQLEKDIEPLQQRANDLTAEVERAEGSINALNIQKSGLQTDIETLEAEKLSIRDEIVEARKGKDKTLADLSEAIRIKSDDLQALDVRQETEANEHKQNIENLKAEEKRLHASVTVHTEKENELTDSVATLQQTATQYDDEVQEKLAALKRKENELDVRARDIKNRERAMSTQLRRNIG